MIKPDMPGILKKNTCRNCKHRRVHDGAMFCHFNPPIAHPLVVSVPQEVQGAPDAQGNPTKAVVYVPQIHSWTSGWAPVRPDQDCAQHKFIAAYDEMPHEAGALAPMSRIMRG